LQEGRRTAAFFLQQQPDDHCWHKPFFLESKSIRLPQKFALGIDPALPIIFAAQDRSQPPIYSRGKKAKANSFNGRPLRKWAKHSQISVLNI